MYSIVTNQVDHLLRKKRTEETPNYAQGYFETSLRTYYKENTKKKMQDMEKRFRNIPLKPKSTGNLFVMKSIPNS